MATRDRPGHAERNRRHWDEHAAGWHGPLARGHWSARQPRWRLWATPESRASMLPDDLAGMRVIELGCGTGYVSAWLARAGAHPVGLDLSREQLATARAMQEFTLAHGEMIRLLRTCGFVIDDLIEVQAPDPAHRDYAEVSADWSRRWPSEEIWKVHLAC